MRFDRAIRWLLIFGVALLAILVLGVVFYLTESFFTVWDRLLKAPLPLQIFYFGALSLFLIATCWLIIKLLVPGRHSKLIKRQKQLTEEGVKQRLDTAAQAGVETVAANQELEQLARRRQTGDRYFAFFGEISSGKSSLIKALLGEEESADAIQVSARGGSTRTISEYQAPAYPGWVFVDVPGLNEADGELDLLASEEARRAHVVVYVCDSDLTRVDYQQIAALCGFAKPVIVALNKIDQYNADQLKQLEQKIRQRLDELSRHSNIKRKLQVVSVSAEVQEEVIRVLPSGAEEKVVRTRGAQVHSLAIAIQNCLSANPVDIEASRDKAMYSLASDKLDLAENEYRIKQSVKITQSYTRKAIVGALAAVAPGTDLLIQGVLATAMIREMCSLYNAPVKDLDVQNFLNHVQKHVGKALPILLAVTGNAMKAFPGIGTVAGGLTHAIAYGLIFDALGKSLAATLARGKGFEQDEVSAVFQESLSENLEERTKNIARLVMALRKDTK